MTEDRDGAPGLLDENFLLEPGMLVQNPARSDWGIGQIQSIDGVRITVNFENSGKLVLDGSVVPLDGSVVPLDPASSGASGRP